jgi:hypothetical protein
LSGCAEPGVFFCSLAGIETLWKRRVKIRET